MEGFWRSLENGQQVFCGEVTFFKGSDVIFANVAPWIQFGGCKANFSSKKNLGEKGWVVIGLEAPWSGVFFQQKISAANFFLGETTHDFPMEKKPTKQQVIQTQKGHQFCSHDPGIKTFLEFLH